MKPLAFTATFSFVVVVNFAEFRYDCCLDLRFCTDKKAVAVPTEAFITLLAAGKLVSIGNVRARKSEAYPANFDSNLFNPSRRQWSLGYSAKGTLYSFKRTPLILIGTISTLCGDGGAAQEAFC